MEWGNKRKEIPGEKGRNLLQSMVRERLQLRGNKIVNVVPLIITAVNRSFHFSLISRGEDSFTKDIRAVLKIHIPVSCLWQVVPACWRKGIQHRGSPCRCQHFPSPLKGPSLKYFSFLQRHLTLSIMASPSFLPWMLSDFFNSSGYCPGHYFCFIRLPCSLFLNDAGTCSHITMFFFPGSTELHEGQGKSAILSFP